MANDKIIDLQEKVLTTDEIERDYIDIKQASQILNNVSTRTAYRYLDEVSETKGINVKVIEIVSNGGKKKLYLKKDIINIAKILNKDKTVLVQVPVNVNDKTVNDTKVSETMAHEMSSSANGVKDLSITAQQFQIQLVKKIEESFSAITELKEGFKEYSNNVRELNDNIRNANNTVQNIMTKIVEQGIDLKEKYLEDRIKRTEIEKQQADTLKLLLEKQKEPAGNNSQMLLIIILVLVIAGGMGWYFISTSQQRLENQFKERLAQDRQIQTEQYQSTIQQLKDSLKAMTVNAAVNATQPAGQGTK
jgi:hypothetical protein